MHAKRYDSFPDTRVRQHCLVQRVKPAAMVATGSPLCHLVGATESASSDNTAANTHTEN